MKAIFRSSFLRDLKKLKDRNVHRQVEEVIEEVEEAADLREIGNLSKMSGGGNFYKIRIGEYRIGLSTRYPRSNQRPPGHATTTKPRNQQHACFRGFLVEFRLRSGTRTFGIPGALTICI